MKSTICKKYGPPEVLQVGEVEKPTPKANEILVRVKATTVNRTDTALLTGYPLAMRLFAGLTKPSNPTLGTDFAGIIEEIGSQVKDFKVGDRVMGFHDEGAGSQAEYVAYPMKKALIKIPDNFSYEEAAASMEGMHYAYTGMRGAKLQKGDKVLVNGATGAIGSALVQMLVAEGHEVTAVGNTPNIEMIYSLGAVKVYDYLKEDFTKVDHQFDLISDSVGKSTWGKCKPLLKPGGIYISSELGPGAENLYLPIFTKFSNKRVLFPIPMNIQRSLDYIRPLIEAGKFKPVIDRRYPLDEIADAYTYVLTGEKTGNVIVTM